MPEIEFRPGLLSDISEIEFYKDSSPIKFFFIEMDCTKLVNDFGYEYFNTSNLKLKEDIYSSFREDLNLKTCFDDNLDSKIRFESWNKLDTFSHPLNCIVVYDRYILNDAPNQKMQKNLIPILTKLIKQKPIKLPLQILIVTRAANEKIKSIYDSLISKVSEVFSQKDVIINIVHKPPDKHDEHFRRIYTNYLRIKSENSFNFFKDNGVFFDQNNDVCFGFIFDYKNLQFFMKELKDIEKYLSLIHNRPAIGSDTEKIYYYPGKKHPFFDI